MLRSDFAKLRYLTGLTYPECMDLFDVRLDTLKSWNSGRHRCPKAVLIELAQLYDEIESTAEMMLIEDVDTSHLPESSRQVAEALVLAWTMKREQA